MKIEVRVEMGNGDRDWKRGMEMEIGIGEWK